jgi:hypothetical protein
MRVCSGRKRALRRRAISGLRFSRYKPLDALASSGKGLIGAADMIIHF